MKEFEEVVIGYLVPDLYNHEKKNFSEKFPYGVFQMDSPVVEKVYVKRLKTKRTKEEAIAYCKEIGENPFSHLDYSDLRSGKENWEYFVEIKQNA